MAPVVACELVGTGLARGRVRRLVLVAASLVVATVPTVGSVGRVSAHSPHDVVTSISIVGPESIIAVVRDRVMRSDDGGGQWSEAVRGLPGDRDPVVDVAMAPSDPTRGYALTSSGRAFRTDDGGWTWSLVAVDLPRHGLVVTSADPDAVVAFGPRGGVAASDDGGRSWVRGDGVGRGFADAVALDGMTVVGITAAGGVLRSDDGGASWSASADPGLIGSLSAVGWSPEPGRSDGVLVVGSDVGELAVSNDGGDTFRPVVAPFDDAVRSIAVTEQGETRAIWVLGRSHGASVSRDGGRTWSTSADGLTTDEQAERNNRPDWNVLAVDRAGGRVFAGGFDGLFVRDEDAAADSFWRSIETIDGYVAGFDVSPSFTDDGLVIATSYVRGAFVSADRGATWSPSNRGLISRAPEGMVPVWRLHGVRFSPDFAEDRTVFTATWQHVVRSDDGGRSWELVDLPPSPDGRRVRQFVIEPTPTFGDDGVVFAGTRQGIVYRSDRGGVADSWTEIAELDEAVRAIAVSPRFDRDRTVLVGGAQSVFLSDDAGQTWSRVFDAGPVGSQSGGVQLALAPTLDRGGPIFAAAGDRLWRSVDRGSIWSELALGEDIGVVEAVAVSPDFARDALVLVSTRNRGLLRSTDGGVNFESAGDPLLERNLLIADYANPTSVPIRFSPTYAADRTIFAMAQDSIVRSTDAGSSWDVLELPSTEEVLAASGRPGSPWPGRFVLAGVGLVVVGAIAWVGLSRGPTRRSSSR